MDISKFYNLVNDFPSKGKSSIDIASLMSNVEAFNYSVTWLENLTKKYNIDNIVAIETRGFIWGAPVAYASGIPLHLARKSQRIPKPTVEKRFASRDRLYSLCLQKDADIFGNVMVIDDVIVSGATHLAVGELLTTHFGIATANQFHASIIEIQNLWGSTQVLKDKGYSIECLSTHLIT
jgi:adenine phosphoribosyltransferase